MHDIAGRLEELRLGEYVEAFAKTVGAAGLADFSASNTLTRNFVISQALSVIDPNKKGNTQEGFGKWHQTSKRLKAINIFCGGPIGRSIPPRCAHI